MTKTTPRYQIINREWLKIFAMIFMFIDHAFVTVINAPGIEWLSPIGRLAFPIFAFQIVEGYTHTSSQMKYIRNMLVFALISELPFNLMMGGELIGPFHQNVMFTFLIALLFMKLIDKVISKSINIILKIIIVAGICMLAFVIGTITFVDYFGFGVLTVLILYVAKLMPKKYQQMLIQFVGLFVINWIFLGGKVFILSNGMEIPEQGLAVLSLIFIWMYNGKKVLTGKTDKVFKYFSYAFYPAHILILSLIALYVIR